MPKTKKWPPPPKDKKPEVGAIETSKKEFAGLWAHHSHEMQILLGASEDDKIELFCLNCSKVLIEFSRGAV